MKLIRFGDPGRERPGLILPDGRRIDASGFGADYDEAFFGSGGLEQLARWVERSGGAGGGGGPPPGVPDQSAPGPAPLPAEQDGVRRLELPGPPPGEGGAGARR